MITEIAYKDKAEWLEIRKHYVGGSDAGAVAGMNPYRSAYGVWAEKTGLTPGFEGNLTTEVGAYLEDLVADLFCRETGKKVRRKNRILVNDAYPWASASVDRLIVGEKAGLEIKTTNSIPLMRKLREDGEEFPEAYYAQCLHYLAVTGLERWYLAVLINCRELRIWTLERDVDEIAALMQIEEAFWRNVTEKTAPPVDGSKDCGETLETIYDAPDRETVDLPYLETRVEALQALKARQKELKTEQTEIENELKDALGNHSYGVAGAYKISWTGSSRSTFQPDAFRQDHPGIDLAPYYNESFSRTLRISGGKK